MREISLVTFFETLVSDEVGLSLIKWRRPRFVVCYWKSLMHGVSPGPETITKSSTNRVDKQTVWMVLEKSFKNVHFDWCMDLEEIRVVSNGFKHHWVRNFARWRTRKRFCSL